MGEHGGENLQQTLVALEEQGWQALSRGAGADFYRRSLTADALMVFPFGVLTREQAIETMRSAPRGRASASRNRWSSGSPPTARS